MTELEYVMQLKVFADKHGTETYKEMCVILRETRKQAIDDMVRRIIERGNTWNLPMDGLNVIEAVAREMKSE